MLALRSNAAILLRNIAAEGCRYSEGAADEGSLLPEVAAIEGTKPLMAACCELFAKQTRNPSPEEGLRNEALMRGEYENN